MSKSKSQTKLLVEKTGRIAELEAEVGELEEKRQLLERLYANQDSRIRTLEAENAKLQTGLEDIIRLAMKFK